MAHWMDVEELASAVLGLDEDSDFSAIEQGLADRFGVEFWQFEKIVEALIPFTVPVKSAVLEIEYHGFVKDGSFLVKEEVK